ncbi:MAG: hypothetical protein AB8E15_03550 [Bdellovibrionales bacterium]
MQFLSINFNSKKAAFTFRDRNIYLNICEFWLLLVRNHGIGSVSFGYSHSDQSRFLCFFESIYKSQCDHDIHSIVYLARYTV